MARFVKRTIKYDQRNSLKLTASSSLSRLLHHLKGTHRSGRERFYHMLSRRLSTSCPGEGHEEIHKAQGRDEGIGRRGWHLLTKYEAASLYPRFHLLTLCSCVAMCWHCFFYSLTRCSCITMCPCSARQKILLLKKLAQKILMLKKLLSAIT